MNFNGYRHFLRRKSQLGATMIEYALLAALVALAAIGGMQLLGGNLQTKFSNIAAQVAS